MPVLAPIGEICSGSLRHEDLLRAFARALAPLAQASDDSNHSELVAETTFFLEEASLLSDYCAADMLLIDLTDALQSYAPENVYFGSAESDSTCFGFWKEPDNAN